MVRSDGMSRYASSTLGGIRSVLGAGAATGAPMRGTRNQLLPERSHTPSPGDAASTASAVIRPGAASRSQRSIIGSKWIRASSLAIQSD